MYLSEIYPEVSLDEVKKAVGFKLDVSTDLRVVQPPSLDDVNFIHSFDPADVILRRGLAFRSLSFTNWIKLTNGTLKRKRANFA